MADEQNTLVLTLDSGDVVIRCVDLARGTSRIRNSAEGFYDGVVFHRVIPASWRRAASTGAAPAARVSHLPPNSAPATRARHRLDGARRTNSANSQFSSASNCGFLDGQYGVGRGHRHGNVTRCPRASRRASRAKVNVIAGADAWRDRSASPARRARRRVRAAMRGSAAGAGPPPRRLGLAELGGDVFAVDRFAGAA